ncbi:hypothetical protein C7405_103268 [Paraburkholderia caballeronis]|uniref:PhaM family polyhydroxyalkanoate granule multifunctional regulatory protein n=1 Tax=Paraburkholderia caballeronis TaxID=416943 RepID=UPI001065581D|nr:PhaM family polyhydroxyalkanoate granule multifunctional regulatory protein [Paraburkholderia caballeronis]TDV37141.1 hypothetical protein C7405_103268 [Paraburkholderia caballeronis]
MTDTAGSVPPFPGFPGFPPAEMLDRMWGMMRLTPFGSAFPGVEPGVAQGFGPSLSMMSDLMAPLTNVEELDKRITDMRAVEQWLKLNLNMLQSAIQALEVQRATLATLRAFGAFAQSQMSPTPAAAPSHDEPFGARRTAGADAPPPDAARAGGENAESSADAQTPAFDASAWWNLLQSQFNQLAQFAMAQPAAAAQSAAEAAANAAARAEPAGPAAKRDASGATKRASGRSPSPRAAKKAPPQPE